MHSNSKFDASLAQNASVCSIHSFFRFREARWFHVVSQKLGWARCGIVNLSGKLDTKWARVVIPVIGVITPITHL